jgi:hypothetical protein
MTTPHHHHHPLPRSGAVAGERLSGYQPAPTQNVAFILPHNLEPKNRCLQLPPTCEPYFNQLLSLLCPEQHDQREGFDASCTSGSELGRNLPSHRRI